MGTQRVTKKPLVTVVMTVYNDEAYVREAIVSILNQTFGDLELVVVDDGAVDQSVEQVLRFSDSRIRVFRQNNTGLAEALNHGLREARGELIARQDADDRSKPERIAQQVQFLREHPEVGLLGTWIDIIDEAGSLIEQQRYPEDAVAIREHLASGRGNPLAHGAVMFRRSVLERVGGYRREFRYCQDIDLWLRMIEVTEPANVPQFLYQWRRRSGSAAARLGAEYGDFARLAIHCARCRRQRRPEPPLTPDSVRRRSIVKALRRLREPRNKDLLTKLVVAQGLLLKGDSLGVRRCIQPVLRGSPDTAYAWILLALSILPPPVARGLWRGIRWIYRRLWWKR